MPTLITPGQRPQRRFAVLVFALVILLFFSRSICGFIIDYFWWRELDQVPTWIRTMVYRYVPGLVAWLLIFIVWWIAHARGMKHAGERLRDHRWYARAVTIGIAFVSFVVGLGVVDGWTVARYVGGRGVAGTWHDPVFNKSLEFYFFELPFYSMAIDFLVACALGGALAYYLAARGWQIRNNLPGFGQGAALDLSQLRTLGRLETGLLKGLITMFLLLLAANFWLGRYELLLSDHGNLMVGVDYVQQNLGLPLQTLKAAAAVLAALLVLVGRRKIAIACAVVLLIDILVPPLVSSLYVKPNELTLEKPFIARHIEATRSAYGLDRRTRETEFPAQKEGTIDFAKNRLMLDNVRLWDWRAFHNTLLQTQPLRPYIYADTDVDRYTLNGRPQQVLLAPRELDLTQLGDARTRWINRSLTFTHGYGLALAEANQINQEGLPRLLVKDAPIQVLVKGIQVTRPEIYFGETDQDPVFVRTAQPEYNYPSGSSEVSTRYEGKGGFPMAAGGLRTIAAISEGDWNILLTNQLTSESRMIMRQRVTERLKELAGFITWDEDPYMVITQAGRLVWMIDGYTTSDAHPYSRDVTLNNGQRFNYIRNAIKATVDAYDGDVHMYVFDETDPLIAVYRNLFPKLFSPASEMPADLRAHARSPEMLFRTQAEIYRTYHMRDPESFYNRADLWDLATFTTGQGAEPEAVPPTYMIATLPGESGPEFLLTVPFTPRGKQNLIGLMVARCDGEHMGEVQFLELPKQEIIPGPIQVEAMINQDQTVSKDLTLWNQQGSQVLRSQILTLPIDNTFLYVAPIYLQASQARMPQLKKVALVVGNNLIYADTYEKALAELEAVQKGQPVAAPTQSTQSVTTSTSPPSAPQAPAGNNRLEEIRSHWKRYRDLSAQGKLGEAGKELDAIDSLVK